MWYQTKQQETRTSKQIADSYRADIERMEKEKAEVWARIKDFTVSANKADDGYKRMEQLTRAIRKTKNLLKKYE